MARRTPPPRRKPPDSHLPGAAIAQTDLFERSQAWWIAVIAGQSDQSHPMHGSDIRARIDGDTLVVSGVVPTPADRDEIDREVEHLTLGPLGVAHVRNDLRVVRRRREQPGLLAQTLVGLFASEEQAGFAAGYLEGHARLRPQLLRLIAPGPRRRTHALVAALLPAAFLADAQAALTAGQFLLVVVVDELDAFIARELIDEETHSLQTLVLPPEPAARVERLRAALRAVERHAPGDAREDHGERTRQRTREHEKAMHDD